ncbi:hypothetical protein [Leptodesmis sp.]|uniref:hypothetical protein n=1 Tax=Leptodesmis sp. TaxID=3100501 RepID=UPI0040535014
MSSNAVSNTSSRLSRSTDLSPAINAQIETVCTETIHQCHQALDRSHFFTLLKNQTIPLQLLQYTFLQYHHWRDRLHQWFGLCIIKADSCNDPDQKKQFWRWLIIPSRTCKTAITKCF